MPASYPSSVRTFTLKQDGVDFPQAEHINSLQDEVTAIEQGLLNGFQHVLKPLMTALYGLGTDALRWKQLLLDLGTLTADAQAIDIKGTWNSSATAFTAIKANITDTASAAASKLLDLQVGGASKFSVDKNGAALIGGVAQGLPANPERFLHKAPMVRVRKSAAQLIPDSMWTAVTFDVEDFDLGGFHDNVTNNSRLTAPVAGKYLVTASGVWVSSSVGSRFLRVRVNGLGGTKGFVAALSTADDNAGRMTISGIIDLAAGDYVELLVFQNSGAGLNLIPDDGGDGVTAFAAVYLGE